MKELKKSYKRFPVNLDIIRLDIFFAVLRGSAKNFVLHELNTWKVYL